MPPLSEAYLLRYGALLPGDYVRLHPSLEVHPYGIIDQATLVTHRIHPIGIRALRDISCSPTQAQSWLQSLRTQGLDEGKIKELLTFLSALGGLEVKRPHFLQLAKLLADIRSLAYGNLPTSLAVRSPATGQNFLGEILRVISVPGSLLLGVTAVATLGGLIRLSTAALGIEAFVIITLSLAAHEIGHMILLQRYGEHPVLIRRGVRLGILHNVLPPNQALSVSLAGPLAGIGFCVICSALFTLPGPMTAVLLIPHLCSLLPWYGDGKSLIRTLSSCLRPKFLK